MTTDVRARHEEAPSPQAQDSRLIGSIAAGVAAAPERLLTAFLCFSFVCATAYVGGVFRPVVVFPATAVVVLLTWRLWSTDGSRAPRTVVGSAAAMVATSGWLVVNLPYLAERVQVSRDSDVYTLTALWLLDHPSPSIPVPGADVGSLGFQLDDGALRPQGNHLVAGVSAAVGWIFGEDGVYAGNLLCGAMALLALYVLARQVVGPLWGLMPLLALAGSLPMLGFSRALYSEPLALAFTFLGAALLWRAWQRRGVLGYLSAGLAFGAVGLARIDGTLPLLGVLGGLTVAALIRPDGARADVRWAAPLLLLGSLPGMLLGFADLWFHSRPYLGDLSSELTLLLAGALGAALFAVLGSVVNADRKWRPALRTAVSWAAVTGAALSAAAFAVMATRPRWMVSRGDLDNGLVRGIQEREGLAVDGTRLYGEDSLQWISWYYGWPVVVVGLLGLVAWLALGARSGSSSLVWLSALVLPSALLYLWTPSITPDQIWAMRRFLPVVVPGLLLATTWIARELWSRRPLGTATAALVALAVVVWPVTTVKGMLSAGDKEGALAGTERVCEGIDGRPTVVTGIDTYLPTVLVLCDVPAVSVPTPSPGALLAAREALGGGPVVVATRDPGPVPWTQEMPEAIWYEQEVWEQSLTGVPDEVFHEHMGIRVGLVQPDGRVAPLPPPG